MADHPDRIGKYEIKRVIGRGGMGVVYLAWDPGLKVLRALKEVSNLQGTATQEFVSEPEIIARFSHPHIVAVHDVFVEHGRAFLVMDFLRRGSLRAYIGHLEPLQIGGVLMGVLEGLEAGERQGIVHRDIKPENLLVDDDGRIQIADYGIAKALRNVRPGVAVTAIGTIGYMPPELVQGKALSAAADLYSLGCVAFELISGEPLFADTTDEYALASKHVNEPVPALLDVAPEWGEWVERLLRKDPARRPPSAAVARGDLDKLLVKEFGPHWRDKAALGDPPTSNPGPVAKPATPKPRANQPRPRRRIAALLTAFVVLGGLVTTVALLTGGDAAAGPPAVEVGMLLNPTGPSGTSDKYVIQGAWFAADLVNGKGQFTGGAGKDLQLNVTAGAGLLGGARLKLIDPPEAPLRCTAAKVVGEFAKRENLAAVLGAYSSTITLRGMAAAAVDKVPLLSGGSAVASLTDPAGATLEKDITSPDCGPEDRYQPLPDPRKSRENWFYRVGANDSQYANVMGGLLHELASRPGFTARRVAVVREEHDIYGNGAWAQAAKLFGDLDDKHLRSFSYPTVVGSGDPNPCSHPKMLVRLRTQIRDLVAFRPDVIIAASYQPDAIAVSQLLREAASNAKRKYTPRVFMTFGSGFLGSEFIEEVGKPHVSCDLKAADPTRIITPAGWSGTISNPSATARTVARLFEREFGHPMDSRSALGFTAMLVLAEAIDHAGSTDHEAVRKALSEINIPGEKTIMPWKGVEFDARGQNISADAVLEQVGGGSYHVVYPPSRRGDRRPVLP